MKHMSAKAFITGNITREPEMKDIGGQKACVFSVATRTSTKDRESGEYITNFYDCTYFGKLAEGFCARAQKGTGVAVIGDVCAQAYVSNGEARPALRIKADSVDAMSRLKETGAAPGRAATHSTPDMDIPF